MKKDIEYKDAPKEIEESLNRAIIIPNFEISQEQVNKVVDICKDKANVLVKRATG